MNNNKIVLIALLLFIALKSVAQMPEKNTDISPLLIGEVIPDTTLIAPDGTKQTTRSIFSKNSTVLLFYRGGWCPYCNLHLSEIQKVENQVVALGYQIVAVSPDSPKNLLQTTAKDSLNYSLYSDSEGALIKLMGIAFKVPKNYEGTIKKGSEGVNSSFLPVPAVFIVDKSGRIMFEYISPNIKNRLSGELLIAVLKNLK